MLEGSSTNKFLSVKKTDHTDLEGRWTTGRHFLSYESHLGITPECLRGKTVLNFGAGASHLEKYLRRRGISANIVEFDLRFDPAQTDNPYQAVVMIPLELYLSKFQQANREKWIELKRKLAGTAGRVFVQGDGRNIPFADRTFNTVLALYSTYQIPASSKEAVFGELLRVGDTIHAGPIFKQDFGIFEQLSRAHNFDIVSCQPGPKTEFGDVKVKFSSDEDYNAYMARHSAEERVWVPKAQDVTVVTALGLKDVFIYGGHTIVLKRRES